MKLTVFGKQLAVAVLASGLVTGCSLFGYGDSATEKAVSTVKASGVSPAAATAISDAKSAIATAKDGNWIWRDTEKFLKQAQTAAEKGDETTAIKLANKAKSQAELAVQQKKLEQTMR